MSSKLLKRKLWADESMVNAVKSVQEGKGLRETSRLYIYIYIIIIII